MTGLEKRHFEHPSTKTRVAAAGFFLHPPDDVDAAAGRFMHTPDVEDAAGRFMPFFGGTTAEPTAGVDAPSPSPRGISSDLLVLVAAIFNRIAFTSSSTEPDDS